MKAPILFLTLLLSTQLKAQISVDVNGINIGLNQEITYNDQLATIHLSFSNVKQIPEYTTGRAELAVRATNEEGTFVAGWVIKKDGYTSLLEFLYPKVPARLVLLDRTASKNDFGTNGDEFLTVCKNRLNDVSARTLTIRISLTFYEKINYDSYGSPIPLADDFKFTVDVWKSATTVAISGLKARLNFVNVPEFKNVIPLNTDFNRVDRNQKDAQGFETRELLKLDFGKQTGYLRTLVHSGSTQDDLMNSYKTSFENFLMFIANGCNSKEIKSKLPSLDLKEWDKLTGFEKQTENVSVSEQKFQKIFAPLDQLNNPDYASVRLFDSFSSGELQGYRFNGLIHSSHCVLRSFLLGAGGKEGERSEPADNYIVGDLILYLLKHPINKDELIMFIVPSTDLNTTTELLEQKVRIFDNFLANLQFG